FPVLDGRNYDQWSMKMKAILGYQDVWDLVVNGLDLLPVNPTTAQQAIYRDAKKKDCKGLCILHQCVNQEIFEKIARTETSKAAWDVLASSYAGDQKLKKVRLQTLRRQYELLGMEESETIATYFTRVQTMTNQMQSCGETLSDEKIVEKILRSVHSRFDHVTVAIQESKDLSTLKLEELQGSLEAHEQRMNERKSVKPSTEQALMAESGNRSRDSQGGRGRSRNNYRGGKGRGGRGRGGRGGRKTDKSHIQCYNCETYDHFADECYSNPSHTNARLAQEEDEKEEILVIMVTVKDESDHGDNWFLDTGCSTHMSGKKEWFVEIDFTVKSRVRFADDRTMKVEGVGKV
ncbi:Retrovirus-related Pol polyprotein from transposon TNT 1-94, partial [Glycine soja]